jgi:hypothetical protein
MNAIEPSKTQDPELNGRLSSALLTGHDFAYWLALLGPWADERLKVVTSSLESNTQEHLLPANYYRQSPLAAPVDHVVTANIRSQLLQHSPLAGFRLWQSMHPEPLSLHNDALRLDDEVVENCELHVRQRLNTSLDTSIIPDPTLLESIIPVERQLLT